MFSITIGFITYILLGLFRIESYDEIAVEVAISTGILVFVASIIIQIIEVIVKPKNNSLPIEFPQKFITVLTSIFLCLCFFSPNIGIPTEFLWFVLYFMLFIATIGLLHSFFTHLDKENFFFLLKTFVFKEIEGIIMGFILALGIVFTIFQIIFGIIALIMFVFGLVDTSKEHERFLNRLIVFEIFQYFFD